MYNLLDFKLPYLYHSRLVTTCVVLVLTVLFLAMFYGLIQSYLHRKGYGKVLCDLLVTSCLLFLVVADMIHIWNIDQFPLLLWIQYLPLGVHMWVVLIADVYVFLTLLFLGRWKRTHLSPMSIPEAFEFLPEGICCCRQNGNPMLVNPQMERLCQQMTGHRLLNGFQFWERIQNRTLSNGCHTVLVGEHPIIRLPNGVVYQFHSASMEIEGIPTREIIAVNISERYRLIEELRIRNRQLADTNQRLREYSGIASEVIRSREILDAKVLIHDNMGKAMLAARRFIEEGSQAVDGKNLLSMWQQNIALLAREAQPTKEVGALDDLMEAAEALGIAITIRGQVPAEDRTVMGLLMQAGRECLTNAYRHAHATEMEITIEKVNGMLEVSYTNDGARPEGDLREGGGLSSLRRRVEEAGGEMTMEGIPRFCVRFRVPERGVTQ